MLVMASNQWVTEQEAKTVPVNLFCLSCGNLRLDWIETGWRCQECGVSEEISMAESNLTMARGGYIYLAADGCPTLKVPVSSADMASAVLGKYRDENGLGSSAFNARCGNVYTNDGKLVARVSYNGRVWNPKGELLQDIEGGFPVTVQYKGI
jgi:hypothetical protein